MSAMTPVRRTARLMTALFVVLGIFTSLGSAGAAPGGNCVALSGSPGWNDPLTWSCGRVPTSGDQALIGSGSDVRVAASPATNPGSLALAGGEITFSNEAALTVDGDMGVQGGRIDGAGSLTVNGAFSKGTDETFFVTNDGFGGKAPDLVLNGTGTHGGGQFCIQRDSTDPDRPSLQINNTFSVVDSPGHFYDSPFNCTSLPNIFVNAPNGHLIKAASGTMTFQTQIINDGKISVRTGTLILQGGTGGETSAGEYVAEAGTTLQFGENFRVAPSGRVGGAGTVTVHGALTLAAGATLDPAAVVITHGVLTLDGASAVSLPSLDLRNGALDTDRPVTVNTLTTSISTLMGTGSVTVPSAGSFAKVGDGTLFITSAGPGQESVDLILDGVASLDGGLICVSRDSSHPDRPNLHINGSFTIGAAAAPGAFACGPQFGTQIHVNGPNGRLSKVGSGATTFNDLEVAGGTVSIASGQTFRVWNTFSQTGGLTDIASGGILEARPTLTGGVVRGAGQVTGNFTNTSGTVRPGSSPGTLTVTGDYTQGPGGTLEVDVSGTAQGIGYDHLSVGGAASLDGTLAVVQGAGFDPQVTDTFTFLTSASRAGAFSTLTGSLLPSGKSYALDYPGSPDVGTRLVVAAATGGDVVVTDCADPDLAGLTVVAGDLIVESVPACDAVSFPNLVEVSGNLEISDNNVSGNIDLSSVATVGGTVNVSGNTVSGDLDLGSLGTTGGSVSVTGNTASGGLDLASLATVSGDLTVSANTASGDLDLGSLGTVSGDLTVTENGNATVNLAALTTVSGNLTLDTTGSGNLDLSGADVSGDLSLAAIGADTVSATTAGGSTEVTVLGGTAAMHVLLPDGTFDQSVAFTIERQADGPVEEGTTADGAPAAIDPLAGYRFSFAVPTLSQQAQLSFTIDLSQLDAETRAALLAGVADGSATLVVRRDEAGAVYQAFARCTGTQTPAADGCVSATLLDALGARVAGGAEPAFVRFDGVAGSFSTWAVALVTPLDATPPLITPTVTGTLGTGGWYTSDVSVSWSVEDPESAVSAQSGCGAETVSSDTAGVTFTCEATSGGGTASQSVTIKRDATAPSITGSRTPEANANGWNNTSVEVTFACADALSGVATCSAPVVLAGEGANQSVEGGVTDVAGNSARATVSGISIDKTGPVVSTSRTPPANANGWNSTDVSGRFEASDGLSGLDGVAFADVLFTLEGADQSAARTFTDRAGNTSTATIGGVSIDKTAPEASIQYDPDTRDLRVLARDGLSGPVTTPAGYTVLPADDEDEDEDEQRRRYVVYDLAGNEYVLVLEVEREHDGEELTVRLEGFADNKLSAETEDDGRLEQKIELGKGKTKETVKASYDGTNTKITIGKGDTKTTEARAGLVLLRLVTNRGSLSFEY